MNYALIENGIVSNIIVSDDSFAAEYNLIKTPEGVSLGWSYIDGEFVDLRPAPEPAPAPTPPTKEDLLAQLQALQVQINGLE